MAASPSKSPRAESGQFELTTGCQDILDYVTQNLKQMEGKNIPNESVQKEVCCPFALDDIQKKIK